ncbi:glycoside hydrolase [Lasiosphaeria ovina]|uniref:alpha-1,2-Mannosidase n=1 Tax=Lasiosphaeria ovina TaxID=92902 RepID=A0AAE0N1P3_9PEZI|nr:glycoside hydrolase [Lasiosphaeria ovina]
MAANTVTQYDFQLLCRAQARPEPEPTPTSQQRTAASTSTMGVSRRRTTGYVFVAVFFLLILTLRRNLSLNPARSPFAPRPEAEAHDHGNGDGNGASNKLHSPWASFPQRYPVRSMRPLPTGTPLALPRIQNTFPTETADDRKKRLERKAAVKQAFKRCWSSYREKAWMSDELTPLSGGGRETFGGWGATLVDSLDTLWIMGMKAEFADAVDAAANISFATTSRADVNIFETNIRYLGGFLAAYDLSGDKRLLAKAVEVGDLIYAAFDTPNRMPLTRWRLHDAARGTPQEAGDNVLLAELASFSLEFIRLSLLTGDAKWFDAVQRITEPLHAQQMTSRLPGMWPVVVSAKKQQFNQHLEHTLGAMSDSAYEYLPKTHALVGGLLPMYRDMYEVAMDTALRHAIFRPMLPDHADVLLAGMAIANVDSGGHHAAVTVKPEGQHLVCFAGGMLALGGRLVENQTHVDAGAKLADGCVWAYRAMPHGVMPETFHMLPCPSSQDPEDCPWDEDAWKRAVLQRAGMRAETAAELAEADAVIAAARLPKGFTAIGDARYILRPEAIESVFVLYRVTGRRGLLDDAWAMWQAIDKATRTDLANAALDDVTVDADTSPPQSDSMESFWLGETLKYFYLVFSDPGVVSLDDFVFNTEAHPLRRLRPA